MPSVGPHPEVVGGAAPQSRYRICRARESRRGRRPAVARFAPSVLHLVSRTTAHRRPRQPGRILTRSRGRQALGCRDVHWWRLGRCESGRRVVAGRDVAVCPDLAVVLRKARHARNPGRRGRGGSRGGRGRRGGRRDAALEVGERLGVLRVARARTVTRSPSRPHPSARPTAPPPATLPPLSRGAPPSERGTLRTHTP